MPPPLRRALWTAAALACLSAARAPGAAAQADAPPDWDRPLEAIGVLRADGDGDFVPDRVGETVLVAGRVSAGTGLVRADAAELYIQDGTGGLRLLLTPAAAPVLTGDSVVVHGTLGFSFGMAEVVDPYVRVISAPPRPVEPVRLPLRPRPDGGRGPDIEGHEGELVDVEGRVIQVDSNRYGRQVVLLSGTDLVSAFSYADRASPVRFEGVRVGDYVRVRGVAVQQDLAPPYNGSYNVFPLSEADVRRAGFSPTEYKYGALAVAALLLLAVAWAALLRRQVRRRSAALRTSEARYSHLFDAVADPVLVLDAGPGGRVAEANKAAQRAFGLHATGDRTDGRPTLLADLAADVEEAAVHLADADRGGFVIGVLELRRADGRSVPFEVSTRRVREGKAFVAVARDVEERRAYEHGLLKAIEAAEEARAEAEEAVRLKTAILANMSHEVRTPLTAIIGFADILVEEAGPDLAGFAESIRGGGQRLLHTLNDIIDFARLDAGRASLQPELVDVVETVRQVVSQLAPLAQRKGLGLRLQAETPSLLAFHSGASLARVVTHLAGNAVKFTDHGEVRVSVHSGPGTFTVRVQDTGVGIAEEFIPDLFEAFKQESEGHGRSHEGTGLGLAVSKRLVDLMGGEIHVWSQKGEGTQIDVTLPHRAPAAAPGPNGGGPPRNPFLPADADEEEELADVWA